MEIKNISDREEYESILNDQGYDNNKVVTLIKSRIQDEYDYPGIYFAIEENQLSKSELNGYIDEFINENIVPLVIGDSYDHYEDDVMDVIDEYITSEDCTYFRDLDSEYSGSADSYYDRQDKEWQDEQDELDRMWNSSRL